MSKHSLTSGDHLNWLNNWLNNWLPFICWCNNEPLQHRESNVVVPGLLYCFMVLISSDFRYYTYFGSFVEWWQLAWWWANTARPQGTTWIDLIIDLIIDFRSYVDATMSLYSIENQIYCNNNGVVPGLLYCFMVLISSDFSYYTSFGSLLNDGSLLGDEQTQLDLRGPLEFDALLQTY